MAGETHAVEGAAGSAAAVECGGKTRYKNVDLSDVPFNLPLKPVPLLARYTRSVEIIVEAFGNHILPSALLRYKNI